MPSVLSLLDLLPNGGGDGKAFESLTTQSMSTFNEQTPDVEGVKYFSWGAWYEPGLIDTWKYPHSIIMEKEGPNDGLVSVRSSKWGQYLGTLEDVNHLDLVGWVNVARYKWAEITGRDIKFKPATFYLGIADWLAAEVESIPNDGERQDGELKSKVGDGVKVGGETESTKEARTTSNKAMFDVTEADDQVRPEEQPKKALPNGRPTLPPKVT
jgi:triacylglycerol lipase